ncbi:MAG TPA: hypothetical protein VEU96_24960 [Bryobacteraceae bacterium]|nr:hypothetical protein [Bryobacteraceae bacterium]
MRISTLLATIPLLLMADDFKLPGNCTLPAVFDRVATKPDPYISCGNDGSGKGGKALDPAKVREDNAKDNFCADASNPVTVDFTILTQMQKKAPNKSTLADNRDSLHAFFPLNGQNIGEGDVVRLLAFVKEAHISDCTAGEAVNCETPGVPNNDFHIPLVDPTKKNPRLLSECTSVTAEMSPHFRPATWSEIDLKTPVKNPVRVTGPLFYDDSHVPCKVVGGKLTGPGPQRISLWEIHPVYAFDVCTSTDPKQCDVASNDASVWTPYDQWVGANADKVQATGQAQRTACSGKKPVSKKPKAKAKPKP